MYMDLLLLTIMLPLAATAQITVSSNLIVSVAALLCGIAIFIKPKLLNYIVGFYLVLVGVLGLIRYF